MTGGGAPDPAEEPRTSEEADRLPVADRMVAFTDAAVAIALTLLVFPLTELVPETAQGAEPAVAVITGHLGTLGSFALSFAVIGRYWLVHHRLFTWAVRLSTPLVVLNLLWVATIAVLPFLAELVATYGSDPFVLRTYVAVLLACSLTLSAMTLVMRRTALRTGETGPPEPFVDGMIAASVLMTLALLAVVAVPAVGYWALLALLFDPLVTPAVARFRRRHP